MEQWTAEFIGFCWQKASVGMFWRLRNHERPDAWRVKTREHRVSCCFHVFSPGFLVDPGIFLPPMFKEPKNFH